MRMNAVLSNPKHPEYGQYTVPLPIPSDQYDGLIEALNAMGMGDPLARDCQMDEIFGEYPILKRLEGKPVNIDELDYLAKRLDSFCCALEGAQFQGAAVSYDYSDMADLINLTFSCQQVTVITDFSDLEQVGREHYMVLNGGCASKEELDNLDGYETALLLIDEGDGVVTPYGVVYDNGMCLSQVYDGRHFPQYFYEPPLLTLTVQESKGAPQTWLYLPAPDLQIKRSLIRAGIVDPADMELSFQASEFPDAVDCVLDMKSESLEELNKLCRSIQRLSTNEIKKLGAVVEYAQPETAAQVRQLAENLDQFDYYTLDGIKSKTVGDGQHGTARWATKQEIRQTYAHIPFEPELWRKGEHLPEKQGLILGCEGPKNHVTALVDTDDIHAMVTAASGAGKTAFFLYPNIEYALASGMSFLCTDTKGDLYRNYAGIAKDFYGYQIAVLDLRNPTRSDGNNLLHLINKYMDIYKANPNDLAAKAKAEKYSKILAKTLINTSGGDSAQYGQNAFFYDSAEGLLTAMFLLVAEYLPTEDENGNPVEKRHIVSVFKLVQELLAPSKVKGKNQFQILLEKLPPNHKARWFAGSALNTAEQAMASVISTVLSRLNAFLDSEMEQILCFDTAIDAEKFCNEKSAIFIVLPEEDQTKYFMVSLILQNLYREILTVADENGGRLKNRVVFFADELGTCPPIQSLELMFSASRSRGLMLVPIVQSITGQLKKNYGAEGAEVIVDNCQVNLYGGFAPASQTAVELSKALGSRTVMSGSISRGKNDPSQSLQMIERPLMTPDELKSMPKGSFIVAKTGVHPMKVKLRLFLDWGIRFGEPYEVPEKAQRAVAYADKQELEESIIRRHYGTVAEEEPPQDVPAAVGGMNHGMQAEKNSRKTILRP